jgi:hypothetical protein
MPVAVTAFWAKSLLHPFIYDFSSCENQNILFAPVAKLAGNNQLVNVILSVVLVMVLAFLVQLINDRYSFIRIRSKLPAILFAIVLGGFVGMHTLHPIYFGAVFVLFAIYRLFSMFEKVKPYSAVFDVGFLLGIGSLFCLNLIILFPAFLISIAILSRETRFREFLITSLGFLLPFAFALSYAFLTNNFQETLNTFAQSVTVPVNHFKNNYTLQIYLVVLVVYTLIASFNILKQYDKKKVSSRKYFSAFFWIFVFSLIGFTFIPATSQEMLVITAIPVTFLISNFFIFMKGRFWSELLFSLLLIIVIFIQFAEQIFNG